jgi:HAD superfamily hydrolase (TIGR01509 family)
MKVETITIDLWGTLLFDGPASDNRYKKRRLTDFEPLLAAVGMPASATALDRAYDESETYLTRIWATQRDVPVDEHVKAIIAAVNPSFPRRVPPALMTALIDAYTRPILAVPPAVDDGALAALETLHGRGYTLALVSNTMRTPGATLRRLLEQFRLLRYFKHATFSDEVRIRKPNPEIFRLTLRAVAGEPATAVHVGDDSILDVQGAQAAGMRAIQVTHRVGGTRRADLVISRLAELPDAIEQLEL